MSALAVSPLVQAEGARVSPRSTARQIRSQATVARAGGATVVALRPGGPVQTHAARPLTRQRGRGAASPHPLPRTAPAPLRLVTADYVAGVAASQRAGEMRLRAHAPALESSAVGVESAVEEESLRSWLVQVGNVVLAGAALCAGAFTTAAVVAGVLR